MDAGVKQKAHMESRRTQCQDSEPNFTSSGTTQAPARPMWLEETQERRPQRLFDNYSKPLNTLNFVQSWFIDLHSTAKSFISCKIWPSRMTFFLLVWAFSFFSDGFEKKNLLCLLLGRQRSDLKQLPPVFAPPQVSESQRLQQEGSGFVALADSTHLVRPGGFSHFEFFSFQKVPSLPPQNTWPNLCW